MLNQARFSLYLELVSRQLYLGAIYLLLQRLTNHNTVLVAASKLNIYSPNSHRQLRSNVADAGLGIERLYTCGSSQTQNVAPACILLTRGERRDSVLPLSE